MPYLICFIVAIALLITIVSFGKTIDLNMVLLAVIIMVGSGGYYALATSTVLEEALLANKILYVTGVFGPAIVLLIICNICRINLPKWLRIAIYAVQTLMYFCVCNIGGLNLFYTGAQLRNGPMGAYLVKTYGPMHSINLVMMLIYTMAGIVVALYSLNRKTIVSRLNVYILLITDMLVVGEYVLQHILFLGIELLPFFFTLAACVYMVLLYRIYYFSIYNNPVILAEKIEKDGYIFFSKNMRFMGGSDYAQEVFPELNEWELEKKVPGSGGRFNTFLRQPLNSFAESKNGDESLIDTFEYKGNVYRYEIGHLKNSRGKRRGYLVQISNVTELFGTDNE
ncbi:MAG: hypothetical protein K6A69_08215 [Lachnospiraceae bacterium]|nr:hypothetical protein [Lachnospiraceae bacterium]